MAAKLSLGGRTKTVECWMCDGRVTALESQRWPGGVRWPPVSVFSETGRPGRQGGVSVGPDHRPVTHTAACSLLFIGGERARRGERAGRRPTHTARRSPGWIRGVRHSSRPSGISISGAIQRCGAHHEPRPGSAARRVAVRPRRYPAGVVSRAACLAESGGLCSAQTLGGTGRRRACQSPPPRLR